MMEKYAGVRKVYPYWSYAQLGLAALGMTQQKQEDCIFQLVVLLDPCPPDHRNNVGTAKVSGLS